MDFTFNAIIIFFFSFPLSFSRSSLPSSWSNVSWVMISPDTCVGSKVLQSRSQDHGDKRSWTSWAMTKRTCERSLHHQPFVLGNSIHWQSHWIYIWNISGTLSGAISGVVYHRRGPVNVRTQSARKHPSLELLSGATLESSGELFIVLCHLLTCTFTKLRCTPEL